MIDLTDPKGRILAAALELADSRPWREITLLEIAGAANMSLADLKQQISGKVDLLKFFTQSVDDAVIKNPPKREEGESARDRLFEVVMNRFDAMAPYKGALKSIVRDGAMAPAQLQAVMTSQYWMLQTAGIATDGLRGQARVAGLMSVYAAVFRKWLDDDDAGLARTMAALDRRLRRGETTLARVDDACAGLSDALSRLRQMLPFGGHREKPAAPQDDGNSAAAAPDGSEPGPGSDAAPTTSGA